MAFTSNRPGISGHVLAESSVGLEMPPIASPDRSSEDSQVADEELDEANRNLITVVRNHGRQRSAANIIADRIGGGLFAIAGAMEKKSHVGNYEGQQETLAAISRMESSIEKLTQAVLSVVSHLPPKP